MKAALIFVGLGVLLPVLSLFAFEGLAWGWFNDVPDYMVPVAILWGLTWGVTGGVLAVVST